MYKFDDLYYVCWIMERFKRSTGIDLTDIVNKLGESRIKDYLYSAEVLHCENPDKIMHEMSEEIGLSDYNPDTSRIYASDTPDLDAIADTYALLIDHLYPNEYAEGMIKMHNSFLAPLIADYPRNLYWAGTEYLAASYKEGKLL